MRESHSSEAYTAENALLASSRVDAGHSGRRSPGYEIFVSNERSGNITVIDGADFKVAGTFPVGKRPRGIHVSPDGATVYVALSGTPIEGPRHWMRRAILFSRRTA